MGVSSRFSSTSVCSVHLLDRTAAVYYDYYLTPAMLNLTVALRVSYFRNKHRCAVTWLLRLRAPYPYFGAAWRLPGFEQEGRPAMPAKP